MFLSVEARRNGELVNRGGDRHSKTVGQLVQEVYDMVGPFAVERDDLHITEAQKQAVIAACTARKYQSFGAHKIARTEDLDGWKFFFNDNEWVMIRASGTEPVLREAWVNLYK